MEVRYGTVVWSCDMTCHNACTFITSEIGIYSVNTLDFVTQDRKYLHFQIKDILWSIWKFSEENILWIFLKTWQFFFTVNYIKPNKDQQYVLFHWIMEYFTDENLFRELLVTSLLEIRARTPFSIIMILIFV